jgi:hypothetical protein
MPARSVCGGGLWFGSCKDAAAVDDRCDHVDNPPDDHDDPGDDHDDHVDDQHDDDHGRAGTSFQPAAPDPRHAAAGCAAGAAAFDPAGVVHHGPAAAAGVRVTPASTAGATG